MRAMDIFCLPSYANEGVPQAILQAMLTALPIVTTPVGAITEAVKDGESALVVSPRDTNALATAISRLIADSKLTKQLRTTAYHIATIRFSHEHMINNMEDIFCNHLALEYSSHII